MVAPANTGEGSAPQPDPSMAAGSSSAAAAGTAAASPPQRDPAWEDLITSLLNRINVRNERPAEPKFKDPDVFDGNKLRYDAWKYSIRQYVDGVEKDRAISLILSYVRGEKVDLWKQALIDVNLENGSWLFGTMDRFWQELDSVFIDQNRRHTAQVQLEALKMGNNAQDFFTEFEQLTTRAGFDRDDEYVLNILQRNVTERYIASIYASDRLPATYDEWKTRVLQLAKQRALFDVVRGHQSQSRQPAAAPAPRLPFIPRPYQPTYAPPAGPPPIPTRRDTTGTLFGGRGQPMDLDRICKKCNARQRDKGTCGDAWHVPNRTTPQTQYRRRWEEAEKAENFFEDIRRFIGEDLELFLDQTQDVLLQLQGSTPEQQSFVEDSA